MEFGITIKPDLTVDRIVSLTREAESAGFLHGWIFDSHVLWMEPFPLMTLMATNTKKMHIGPCVTNPAVREATVTSRTAGLVTQGPMCMFFVLVAISVINGNGSIHRTCESKIQP